MKNLPWFHPHRAVATASSLLLQGKAIRRVAWHRWITWEHWLGWITQPPVDGIEAFKRIALASDFTAAEFLAADWTDEPWDAAFPPPVVAPSEEFGTLSSGAGGSLPTSGAELPVFLWGMGGRALPGCGGGSGRTRPHNPPAGTTPTVRCTFRTDFVPAGDNCIFASQLPTTCTIVMTVTCNGGPGGVFPGHIAFGAETVPGGTGRTMWSGYTEEITFLDVPVNPSATISAAGTKATVSGVDYHATDVFTFQAACDAVDGCTDQTASNYDPAATNDDGSCIYPIPGCTDPTATNYDPAATADDGSCTYPPVPGCTDPTATNYDPAATVDDGSCLF